MKVLLILFIILVPTCHRVKVDSPTNGIFYYWKQIISTQPYGVCGEMYQGRQGGLIGGKGIWAVEMVVPDKKTETGFTSVSREFLEKQDAEDYVEQRCPSVSKKWKIE